MTRAELELGPAPTWTASEQDLRSLVDRYLHPISESCPVEDAPGTSGDRFQHALEGTCTSTNQYVLREKIGEGGMGVVYRAFDEKLHRDVALKVLVHQDEDALERFLREREITACLDHPNFVRILAMGYLSSDRRSLPFYTMPLIRGMTLEKLVLRRQLMDSEGARLRQEFPSTLLLGMVGQICLALQSAHDKRIIHRDLKPANILVGPYGEVYITDFGLAKVLTPKPGEPVRFDASVMEQLAQASPLDGTRESMMGTPYYMAPEQAAGPGAVDHRADIFGLGALLYFILTSRKPRYLDAVVDRQELLERKRRVIEALKPVAGPTRTAASLLAEPLRRFPESVRSRLEEYREILGLLSNMEFYKLRLTLKKCAIVRPNALLDLRRAGPPARIPPVLEGICMKALAPNPEDRYPSCRALWQALHDHLESVRSKQPAIAGSGESPPG